MAKRIRAHEWYRMLLVLVEASVNLSGERPKTQGFGTEMIEWTLAYDIGGAARLRFEWDGLHCIITVPGAEILMEISDSWLSALRYHL